MTGDIMKNTEMSWHGFTIAHVNKHSWKGRGIICAFLGMHENLEKERHCDLQKSWKMLP